MNSKVFLFANKKGEIKNFLEKYDNKQIELEDSLYWQKEFSNPIEISEIIAAFADNINKFNLI